jgi:hypothetical protein
MYREEFAVEMYWERRGGRQSNILDATQKRRKSHNLFKSYGFSFKRTQNV